MNFYVRFVITLGYFLTVSGEALAQLPPAVVPLELRAQFNGQYDYKIIGNTLNEFDNWQNPPPQCQLLTQSSATLNLEPGQTVESAYLYWAGIGDGLLDPEILLNGVSVFADEINVVDPEQSNLAVYFGSFKDITELVQLESNGSYTFSELDLNPIITTYCTNGLYYSGWSILVVYEDSTLPTQQVNIYDGFASVYGQPFTPTFSTTINLGSLNITNTQDARMGYLAWNGSPNLFSNESISFNGNLLSNPPLNPVDNPFNGTNSYTVANDLFNLDLDFFDISNYLEVGDTDASLTFNSLFNRFIQNVVTVTQSELPDATVDLLNITNQNPCDDRDISLEVSINNFESSDLLPFDTPLSVFVVDNIGNEVFLDTFFTQSDIPIGGSESQIIDISIPDNIPENTTLILKVNTLADGTTSKNEANVLNNVVEQELLIATTPTINTLPTPLSVCGSLSENTAIDITQNNLSTLGVDDPNGVNIQYFTSNANAQTDVNPITDPQNYILNADPQQIFIRVENNLSADCFTVASFEARYDAVPEILQTLNLEQCQVNGEMVNFNLTENNAVNLGISNPENTSISYFETLTDAENSINAIANPTSYSPENDSQTLFVRAENTENADCFDVSSFDVEIFSVDLNPLNDLNLEACLSLGEPAMFDLTVNEPLALGNQNPQDFNLSYHLSETDAQNGNAPIANPSAFELNTNQEEVWLRLERDDTAEPCFVIDSFSLQVEDIAVINNVNNLNIQACIFPGESATFDLTENTELALGNQNPDEFLVSYFISEAEAQNNLNPIDNPSNYDNLSNPQTIWLRLENTGSTSVCYDVKPFEIEVSDASLVNFSPDPLVSCDLAGGFAEFDLTQSVDEITFGNSGLDVSFHLSLSDAENNTNPLSSPFTNTVPGGQTLFFRTEEAVNSCIFTGSLELNVLEKPELNPDNPILSACAEDGNTGTFNLEDINPTILVNGDSSDFEINYHLSENNAINGTDPIVNFSDFSNTTNPQNLWVRVSNDNDCFSTAGFQLEVLTGAVIEDTTIDDVFLCSETVDDLFATLDLTEFDQSINPNPNAETLVVYYEGLSNFNTGNAIENPDDFSVNLSTTTIIAEVVNVETLCVSPTQVSFGIFVNPLPDFNLPENIQLCIDSTTNEVIDNSFSPPVLDTGLSETDFAFEWFLNGNVLENSSSNLVATSAGEYQVVVSDLLSGCSFSQNTFVNEINPPVFNVDILSPAFSGESRIEINSIQGEGSFEFQLDNEPWVLLGSGETSLILEDITDGIHVIRARDLSGCGVSEVQFTILGFAPFFTPNADGINDYWNIQSLQNQPEAKIFIFDRYGKLIYEANPLLIGWDGTYQGRQMPAQDYWFRVEFTDPQTDSPAVFSGHFTLKR